MGPTSTRRPCCHSSHQANRMQGFSTCSLAVSSICNPPEDVFHWEQLAVFKNIRERNGSSSLFFACNVPQEIGALPHYVLRAHIARFDVSQLLLPKYHSRLPRPNKHVFFTQFSAPPPIRHLRNGKVPSSSKPSVSNTAPESTSAFLLFCSCLLKSLVTSMYFLRITVSIQRFLKRHPHLPSHFLS